MDVVVLSLLVATLLVLGYVWATWNNNYWRKKGVFQIEPTLLIGSMGNRLFLKKSFHDSDLETYRDFEGHRFGGNYEFRNPVLWIRDPELIKDVLVKSFDHFVDHRVFDFGDSSRIFSLAVSNLEGQQWKEVRNIMSPTFTSGKMKRMFGSVLECADQLKSYFEGFAEKGEDVEVKDVYGRFTMDVIAKTAFGVQCNSFKDSEATFPKMANKLLNPGALFVVSFLLHMAMPTLMRLIKLPVFDIKAINFFEKVVSETIQYREKNGIKGNDFLQLLLDAKKGELEEEQVTEESEERKRLSKQILDEPMIVAQGLIFFIAGYETTASTLGMLTYELALNQDIQDRLFEEVDGVIKKHGGNITYESLNEMEYLDMVLQETLRRRSPVPRLERKCTEDYLIPGTEVTIEKGTTVIIPAEGIHLDEKHYPEPEKFDPERFSSKSKRNPYLFLTFGQGPRNCLGMRFAQMEAKAAVVTVVRNFRFLPCAKTQIPLRYSKKSNFLKAEKGLWLKLENRT